jgi:hypothetical protein
LLGRGQPDTATHSFSALVDYQFHAYADRLPFAAYHAYESQIGGQGFFFSCVDRALRLPPRVTLRLFRALTSLLSSLALALIVSWFFTTFGLGVALWTLGSAVLSQWLAVFGGNLFWSVWAFYLPMLVVTRSLQFERTPAACHPSMFGALVFLSVLAKCAVNGYEYLTTTLIMMMVPVVYYAAADRWRPAAVLWHALLAIAGASLAILLSLVVLCLQIASVEGTVLDGARYVMFTLGKRTYGDPSNYSPAYTASLSTHMLQIIAVYLKGTFLDMGNYIQTTNPAVSRFVLNIRYGYVVAMAALASMYLCRTRRRLLFDRGRDRVRALLISTWFSLLAPLSWFAIFKAHSFIHTHLNYIVWQMPFTLYGFALCGVAAQCAWRDLRRRGRSRRGGT